MASDTAAATLGKASGSVYVERQGTRISLAEGDTINATDKVVTAQGSTAEIRFNDGSTASLSPGTTLEVKDFSFGEGAQPSFILNLAEGTMRSVSGELVRQNPEAFKIVTPQATVGIRGTELFTAVMPGGQEVHAVLHIGKGHIVSITSHDGRSIVMDSALQAVNMSDGEHGALVKQTFQLNELQQVIKNIAPTQVQKPIQPQGVEGEAIPGQSDQSGQSEQGAAAPAASTASTVVIIHEGESASTAQIAAENTATGAAAAGTTETLLATVEQLQGALADAGFTVTVTSESALQSAMTSSEVAQGKSASDVSVAETVQENVSQVITKPELAQPVQPEPTPPVVPAQPTPPVDSPHPEPTPPVDPPQPTPPVDPPQPTPPVDPPQPEPTPPVDPPQPDVPPDPTTVTLENVNDDVTAAALSGLDPDVNLTVTVTGNVSGSLMPNASELVSAQWGSDTITVQGSVSGSVYGDAYKSDDTGSALITQTFGNDSITVGAVTGVVSGDVLGVMSQNIVLGSDTLNVGALTGAGVVTGDVVTVTTSNAVFGHDSITIASVGNGAAVYGDGKDIMRYPTEPSTTARVTFGNDEITVNGDMNGTIYGDAYSLTTGMAATFGNDIITVTGDVSGTIVGDVDTVGTDTSAAFGKDIITVGSLSGGSIYGDSPYSSASGNDDTIDVLRDMNGGNIHAAAGNDSISVGGTMSGGTISAGMGNDSVTVGSLGGGTIYGEYDATTTAGDDTIIVQGPMTDGTIYGDGLAVNVGGNDTIEVRGDMSGGLIHAGAGNDTINVGITTANGVQTVTGTLSNGTITGGAGDDTIATGSITVGGNNAVSIDGGAGANSINTGAISTSGNATVLITGSGGTDTITTGTIAATAGTTVRIDAGAGSDTIVIGGYQGEGALSIDLGNDSVRDTLSLNANTIQGDITINNYKLTQGSANDSIIIAGLTQNATDVGSQVKDISLTGNTFTMRMLDNSVVTITGDFGTTDATDVYRTLVASTQP